jgi:DNA repair protein RecO (recombination protein O)
LIEKTEAIVLNSLKYGDTSKILNLFTLARGRMSVIAKGARRPKNKFGSSLEPLNHIFINYYYKDGREIQTLTDSEIHTHSRNIHKSIEKLGAGMMILEAIYQAQQPGSPNEELFYLASGALAHLNAFDSDGFSVFSRFMLQMAALEGWEINFSGLDSILHVNCFISLENGSVSPAQDGKSFAVPLNSLKKLSEINSSALDSEIDIILEHNEILQIHDLFVRYFGYHLERPFRFRSFSLIK